MDSHQLIDAQFDRAVEIVQSLPKTGPIQTGYDEKLTMYSLYKQATVGNVEPPRPSVWDMLGRAKWDAWAKHKDLDPYEAKWMYVDALLKVLRRYSDKTVARDLVRELESYDGEPQSLEMSASMSRPRAHSSSGSSGSSAASPPAIPPSRLSSGTPGHLRNNQSMPIPIPRATPPEIEESTSEEEDDETDDDALGSPVPPSAYSHHQMNRPHSSVSSHRYRTPMASMLMTPPTGVPATQPMPNFQTPSAFEGGEGLPSSIPASAYPTTSVSYPGNTAQSSRTDFSSPPNVYPIHGGFRPVPQHGVRQYSLQTGITPRPPSRPVLESAIENLQAHVAALNERIETLEGLSLRSTTSLHNRDSRSGEWSGPGRVSPLGGFPRNYVWNLDNMGMWSIVLKPLSRIMELFDYLLRFIANNEGQSPALAIIRQLFLDISFFLCVLAVVKFAWRRSGMRRQEVVGALRGLWRFMIGYKAPRVLVDRAV